MKKIYTSEQWAKDGDFKAEVGQEVERSIYYHMLECLPPKRMGRDYFLVGEPYDHFGENFRARYRLFYKHNGHYYNGGLVENDVELIYIQIDELTADE